MPRQHMMLALGALLVGGLAVYLFLEVQTPPAVASVTKAPQDAGAEARRDPEPDHDPPTSKSRSPWSTTTTPLNDLAKVKPSVFLPRVSDASKGSGSDHPDPDQHADPKSDMILDEVNKAYDRQDYDEAKAMAIKLLGGDPNNIRMLRVVVSSSCILGDNLDAQKYYDRLPQRDRDQMKTRCKRYDIVFSDSVSPPT